MKAIELAQLFQWQNLWLEVSGLVVNAISNNMNSVFIIKKLT